jgi:protein-S-isoprenylcysteine O-methyltransferase Ste14
MSGRVVDALELKLPPALAAGLVWIGMALVRDLSPQLVGPFWRLVAAALIGVAVVFAVAGVVEFRRFGTTVDPTRPGRAGVLVEGGIFRISRNPMYLGMVVATLGIAVGLGSAWCLVGPPLLAAWLHRFQIRPEERILVERFGTAYQAYSDRVPRWLGLPRR